MTCIVGIANEEGVWIGGDSAGIDMFSLDINTRGDRKVFTNGDFILGFEGSFRMGQLLRHTLNVPEKSPSRSSSEYLVVTFIDAVKECLTTGGWMKSHKGKDKGGRFIVGYEGRLFVVHADFQVEEPGDNVAAIGCGEPFALGALDVTPELPPKKRIMLALRSAANRSAAVRGPFYVLKQKRH